MISMNKIVKIAKKIYLSFLNTKDIKQQNYLTYTQKKI
jgi:hypothetical protein